MAQEITLNDLFTKQEAVTALIYQIQKESDVEKIQELTLRVRAQAAELEALAKAFEAQELAKAGPPPRGSFEVLLTPAQRQRILDETGVTMETVCIEDEWGVLNQAMPDTDPRQIERAALEQARRRQVAMQVEEQARADVLAILEDLEQRGGGQVQHQVARLRQDPTWLNGLLHKK